MDYPFRDKYRFKNVINSLSNKITEKQTQSMIKFVDEAYKTELDKKDSGVVILEENNDPMIMFDLNKIQLFGIFNDSGDIKIDIREK